MRRLFRFSLRTLLIVMLIAGIGLGLYVRSVRRQQSSVEAIQRLGGWVYYDCQIVNDRFDPQAQSWAPPWVLSRIGEDWLHDVVSVNMVYNDDNGQRQDNRQMTDEALTHLDGFPDLEMLLLRGGQASDEGLAHVGKLRRLRTLYIWDASGVSDEGVRHLRRLKRLEFLHLSDSRIDDESLAVLSQAPKLTELSLQGNRFTDEGLKHLQEMTQLTSLWIGLSENKITDAGLAHLQGLTSLEELDLQQSLVTNDGLRHLTGLKNLKSLYLSNSKVTDISVLQKALPNCRIDGVR